MRWRRNNGFESLTYGFVMRPDLMHWVQTLIRLTCPACTDRTCWRFGYHRVLVLLWA